MHYDFRSDTVTQPSPGMRQAMLDAPLGDDVYGEDPSVNALQDYAANLFGMEAALFCASGTMTNQIAIQLHAGPLTEVICAAEAHVYLYEVGGIAYHTGANLRLLPGRRGILQLEDIAAAINPVDVHLPSTRLVCLENTFNRGGGACYELEGIARIHALCQQHQLKLHLDGARLMNALVAKGQHAPDFGKYFHTISLCLSKGLGAPVGSLLLGSGEDIARAKRLRKVFGGGWRQAGMLAAAGLYALQHQVQRLAEDHARARWLGEQVKGLPYVAELLPVETNLVLFRLLAGVSREALTQHMAAAGVKIGGFGVDWVRLVTHLDVEDTAMRVAATTLQNFNPQAVA